jgi:hypothetical protein
VTAKAFTDAQLVLTSTPHEGALYSSCAQRDATTKEAVGLQAHRTSSRII